MSQKYIQGDKCRADKLLEKYLLALLTEKGKGPDNLQISLHGQEKILLPKPLAVYYSEFLQFIQIQLLQLFLKYTGKRSIRIYEQRGQIIAQGSLTPPWKSIKQTSSPWIMIFRD